MVEENKKTGVRDQEMRIATLEKQMAVMLDYYQHMSTRYEALWMRVKELQGDPGFTHTKLG